MCERNRGSAVDATQGLVFHYFADEALFGWRPPRDRLPEIDMRSVRAMLARLVALDSRPLTEARPPERRLIGCCRDFTVKREMRGSAATRPPGHASRVGAGNPLRRAGVNHASGGREGLVDPRAVAAHGPEGRSWRREPRPGRAPAGP